MKFRILHVQPIHSSTHGHTYTRACLTNISRFPFTTCLKDLKDVTCTKTKGPNRTRKRYVDRHSKVFLGRTKSLVGI